ncbi:MAG: hypothetical protein V2A73_10100 [Pseudomonadota bacterium]
MSVVSAVLNPVVAVLLLLLFLLGGGALLWRRRKRSLASREKENTAKPTCSGALRSSPSQQTELPVDLHEQAPFSVAVITLPVAKVVCPICRRRFRPGTRFCPFDSSLLLPAEHVEHSEESQALICPRCHHAFGPGARVCPSDGEELVPMWEAVRGRLGEPAPTGVIGKICPHCAARYDLANTFCSKDGMALRVIN